MASEAQMIGYELLKTGTLVSFRIVVRSNGSVTLETIGRGKAALRWLEQQKGKKLMQLVGQ